MPGTRESLVELTVRVVLDGEPVTFEAALPAAATRPRRLLPLLREMEEEIVDRASRASADRGEPVSCRAGCGACCRQIVPISKTEAHVVRELVEAMPEERRATIRARFEQVTKKLEEAGFGDLARGELPRDVRDRKGDAPTELGLAYMKLGIACPFLEDGSCSIHLDRPLACREYSVTSPPELCTDPSDPAIRPLHLQGSVADALLSLERRDGDGVGWVPLSIALSWSERHPDVGRARPGPELVKEIVAALGPDAGKRRRKAAR